MSVSTILTVITVVTKLIVATNNLLQQLEEMQQEKTKDPSKDMVKLTSMMQKAKKRSSETEKTIAELKKLAKSED